jgi:tetratricopeptide (TPR) repeat protein
MKKIVLSAVLAFSTIIIFAQDNTISAFSKSYGYEISKEYSKAIHELDVVYVNDSYTINLRLGWLHYLNGDYIKSQTYYNKAIVLKPTSIEARLGYAYPAAALKNWNDVVANYEEILKINPNHSQTNYKLAYIYHYIKKDNATALTYLTKVLELYPFDIDANYLMAKTQLNMGNIKEAKAAIIIALQYNSSSKEALKIYETVK